MKLHTASPVGATTRIVVTDVGQTLAEAGMTMNSRADGALITCEANDIRFAFNGTVPTVGGLGHLLYEDDYIYLGNGREVLTFRVCNRTAGLAGIIHVTLLRY